MPQPQAQRDRRRDPRRPAAFAFWFRRDGDAQPTSAWMLDTSQGGAAFLCSTTASPPLPGERVALSEMYCDDVHVRGTAPPLPPYARVLRIEGSDGPMRRVAVRFEARGAVRRGSGRDSWSGAACHA